MSMLPTLTLPEELLLLAMDHDKGKVRLSASTGLEYALAGGQLMELAVAGRLSLEGKTATVIDGALIGDDVLDGVLQQIVDEPDAHTVKWWVYALHAKTKHLYFDRLAERGAVSVETHKVLGVIPVTRYPENTPDTEAAIRARLRRVLLDRAKPDDRAVGLVGLMVACNLEGVVLPDKTDRKRAHARIQEITDGQAVSEAVTAIVNEINAAVMSAVVASTVASSAASS